MSNFQPDEACVTDIAQAKGALLIVEMSTDGTRTEVFLREEDGDPDLYIGYGLARRHEDDLCDPGLGASLALARAFEDAADLLRREVIGDRA